MRRLTALLLVLMTAIALMAPPVLALGANVQVDGKTLLMEKSLLTTEKSVLAPAGVIAKALGGSVTWNEAEGTGLLVVGTKKIELTRGEASVKVNGHPVQIDAPVEVEGGEVYLPATFLVLQFGGRLKIDHPAMKEARAMQLLAQALNPAEADRDSHAEMTVRLEEPDYFWVNFHVAADSQVRGKDSLTTMSIQGPLVLKESGGIAVKNGKVWNLEGGTWEENTFGQSNGMLGDLAPMLGMAAMSGPEASGLAQQMFMTMLVEARAGEQRTEGAATVQDVHVVVDLGGLMGPLMGGGGRRPDGTPITAPDPDMPEIIFEKALVTVTVDLATGRAVGTQFHVLATIAGEMPGLTPGSEIMTSMRMEVLVKESNTLNSTPIAWPEAIQE